MTRQRTAAAFAGGVALALCVRGVAALPGELISGDDDCASAACGANLLQQGSAAHRRGAQAPEALQLPETMQAATRSLGGYSVSPRPVPTLKSGQALVKVAASSVNPLDWKLPLPGPVGRDFAGTVARVEAPCALAVGDQVWGDAMQQGAFAEYLAVDCGSVGARPSGISATEAAVLPHVSLTALAAFAAAGAPWSAAPTILILGGSGGVGTVAIQIAKDVGAGKVITTASPQSFDLVRGLGADQTIDYHTEDFWSVLGADSVDVVLDAVGEAGTGDHAYEVLKSGGRFITLLPTAMARTRREGVSQAFVHIDSLDGSTQRKYLDTLKGFVDAGALKATIFSTYPLADVASAMAESREGHARGKVAVAVAG